MEWLAVRADVCGLLLAGAAQINRIAGQHVPAASEDGKRTVRIRSMDDLKAMLGRK
jgi:hypothetical protein